MAKLAHFQRFIQDGVNVVPLAAAEVRDEATGNLAPLFSDRAGMSGIANPTAADANGLLQFYVEGGAYQIVVTSGAFSATWRYEGIATGSEYDVVDEDDMASDSNDKVPTQQSVKAYVDDEVADATPPASTIVSGLVELATTAEAVTGSDTARAVTPAALAGSAIYQGVHLLGHWPARALKPAITSGCAALNTAESSSNKVNDEYLSFANASTLYAGFRFRAPKSSDETAGFIMEVEWMEAAGASAHVCRWQAEMQAQGDGDTVDSAWGTAVAVDDTSTSGTRRFATTGTITPGGSWAEGDMIHVRVARLGAHANDTLDVAAYLLGVTLNCTIAAKNDA